jgi:uncharacterized protein
MESVQYSGRVFESAIRVPKLVVRSRYLKVLSANSGEDMLLYHSLFGNLHSVPRSYENVIRLFESPQDVKLLVGSRSDSAELQEVIDRFTENYFLVPEGFDERTLVDRELLDRSKSLETGELINAVQLNVSEGCNLKCTYCFADRVDERASAGNFAARNEQKFMSAEMAMESIEAVESLIRKNGGTAMVIKFFGREPLLNWPVVEAVIDRCEAVGDGFQFFYAITTNGTLFTPEMVRKFKAVKMMTVVSLDGMQEANLARITHDGKESFSMVDRGLKLLAEEGLKCSVASVLSEANFDALTADFLGYLESRSVKQWEIKLAMQNDGSVARSAADYAKKLVSLYTHGKQMGIALSGDWYDPVRALFHVTRRVGDEKVDRLAANSCSATDHQISIEPSGNVFGCRALETKLGNVNDLNGLFKGEDYRSLSLRTYYNVPACNGCKLEGFCQGVCIGHSERSFQDIYQPDTAYCDVYRELFDIFLPKLTIEKAEPKSVGESANSGSFNQGPFQINMSIPSAKWEE